MTLVEASRRSQRAAKVENEYWTRVLEILARTRGDWRLK